MNDNTDRTFLLVATVVLVLMLMHLLPDMSVGSVELRPVEMLADLAGTTLQPSSTGEDTDAGTPVAALPTATAAPWGRGWLSRTGPTA